MNRQITLNHLSVIRCTRLKPLSSVGCCICLRPCEHQAFRLQDLLRLRGVNRLGKHLEMSIRVSSAGHSCEDPTFSVRRLRTTRCCKQGLSLCTSRSGHARSPVTFVPSSPLLRPMICGLPPRSAGRQRRFVRQAPCLRTRAHASRAHVCAFEVHTLHVRASAYCLCSS